MASPGAPRIPFQDGIFGVKKKLTWKKIPVGAQNVAPIFGTVMAIIQS